MANANLVSLRRISLLAGALFMTMPMVPPARSAGQPPPPPNLPVPKNLQVFPKDIKVEQLIAEMDGIAVGLGVGCDHCHTQAKLPPGATLKPGDENLDFSLDDKATKRTARQMILMLRTINAMVPPAVGKPADQAVHVQCATCHHGMPTPPRQLAEVLSSTTAQKGSAAAVAQFKDLRKKYFGANTYDFSDGDMSNPATPRLGGLGAYVLQLVQGGKLDEAQTWLKLNFEYYPNSAANWALMSSIQLGKKDKAGAIKSAQKAIELAPRIEIFKGLLEQAKAMPQASSAQAQ